MPSAKILSEKQAYVADLKAKFESAVSGCVVAYGGINVENDTKLRKELREAGVDYMVVKNTCLLYTSDAAETNAIAKLPNREGMLSMFAGALTSTLSGLAVAMQAYADKQEEPAA